MVVQAPSKLLPETHDGATLASEHSDQSSSKLSSSLGEEYWTSVSLDGSARQAKGYHSRDGGSSAELKSAVVGVVGGRF
jgi:hypothetical protein